MKTEEYYLYSYFKTPSPQAEKYLTVSDGMGYTAASDFLIDRKFFYNYLAFYVRQGTFHVEQYGKNHVFHAGEGAVLNLMDPHRYYSDAKDTAHLLWFHFQGASMGKYYFSHLFKDWYGSSPPCCTTITGKWKLHASF